MPVVVRRRALLSGAAALGANSFLPQRAFAVDALPSLPISPIIAGAGEAAAVTADFIADQLATADDQFGPAGMSFEMAPTATVDAKFRELETREDRDALGGSVVAHRITVFFVASLRDVDDPKNHRMGVTWRKLTDLRVRYIIVAASARTTTMAHELGHFFGLDHSSVRNNLMSYDRDGGRVSLNDAQLATVRRNAQGALARKDLVPA